MVHKHGAIHCSRNETTAVEVCPWRRAPTSDTARSRSNRVQSRKQHVSVSFAASQQRILFLRCSRLECPRPELFLQHRSVGGPKPGFLIVVQNVFETFSEVLQPGVRSKLFLQSRGLGIEVRAHVVVGNGGSSRSDVDTVPSLQFARVGKKIIIGMEDVFRTLGPQLSSGPADKKRTFG